jgi:hypothetical protein
MLDMHDGKEVEKARAKRMHRKMCAWAPHRPKSSHHQNIVSLSSQVAISQYNFFVIAGSDFDFDFEWGVRQLHIIKVSDEIVFIYTCVCIFVLVIGIHSSLAVATHSSVAAVIQARPVVFCQVQEWGKYRANTTGTKMWPDFAGFALTNRERTRPIVPVPVSPVVLLTGTVFW